MEESSEELMKLKVQAKKKKLSNNFKFPSKSPKIIINLKWFSVLNTNAKHF